MKNITEGIKAELEKDQVAMDNFFKAMQIKMKKNVLEKDRYGWEHCDPEILKKMFYEHVEKFKERGETGKEDLVDVANLAMFLFHLVEDKK